MIWKLLHGILKLTVLTAAAMIAVVAYEVPYGWVVGVAVIAAMVIKRNNYLDAHGTARWAEVNDLEGMIDE
jgi:hypothetical protein